MEMDTQGALTEFKKHKARMNNVIPSVMKHLDGLFQASLSEAALSVKQKELIIIGISVATHCEPCILVHLEKAVEAGATDKEILETCGVAIAMGGGSAMAYVPLVLKFLEGQRCDDSPA